MFEQYRCMTPACGKARRRRGLCLSCYSRIIKAARKGQDSLDRALAEGRILPADKAGQRCWGTRDVRSKR